ncbi:hypothetical protein [Streptomyces sp. NPDC102360]|uniref:hypothetical protein n=1 Tax=Streptomyces sp. NPDC102360 TaxID=3366160 RepID=UPI003806C4E4
MTRTRADVSVPLDGFGAVPARCPDHGLGSGDEALDIARDAPDLRHLPETR